MRRFFVAAGVLGGREVRLPPDLSRRLATVLRLKPGDRVVLADGGRVDYEVELVAVSPGRARGSVVGERTPPPEPALRLTLCQSLVRPQRFELALEKGTELGVSRFLPLVSGRTQVRTVEGSQRAQRWRRIVTEAAEQCGRGRVPEVAAPLGLEEAVRVAEGLLLVPWEGESARGILPYLRSLPERPQDVALFIGPEGGFAEGEVGTVVAAGGVTVSLGPRILRSETAGIVAAALVMGALGELGG